MMFALVDCNNFYVSCERVFDPMLRNKPVVVLSSNDGCIVARSNEVKEMGVPMGVPYFQYKKQLRDADVKVFSSNYQLYGDMSRRVMQILRQFIPEMEVYSIDEAFLLMGSYNEPMQLLTNIRSSIMQWVGIPVSIGMASTKTLAKIAGRIAKKEEQGIYVLSDDEQIDDCLAETEIENIWGISSRLGRRLRNHGIHTARQLCSSDGHFIQETFSLAVQRMRMELCGTSCINLNQVSGRKNIMASRSFGRSVRDIADLQAAIANHVATACTKLRAQKSRASAISVYLWGKMAPIDERERSEMIRGFSVPSSDTGYITGYAQECLRELYKTGYTYRKTGIVLLGLMPTGFEQQTLFERTDYNRQDITMQAIDSLNKQYGNNTVFTAAQGIDREWNARSDMCSKRYTTRWDELMEVH